MNETPISIDEFGPALHRRGVNGFVTNWGGDWTDGFPIGTLMNADER
jgi:hypothetical protein